MEGTWVADSWRYPIWDHTHDNARSRGPARLSVQSATVFVYRLLQLFCGSDFPFRVLRVFETTCDKIT